MKDVNIVVLTGRLGKDPEFSTVGRNDTALAKASIAVTMWRGSERGEQPVWVWLNWWGDRSKVCEYIHTGMKITVHGALNIQERDGKWYTSVDVDETVLPDKDKKGGEGGGRRRDETDERHDRHERSKGRDGSSSRSSSRSKSGKSSRTPF
jgi:single-stranded DNA-binding protein